MRLATGAKGACPHLRKDSAQTGARTLENAMVIGLTSMCDCCTVTGTTASPISDPPFDRELDGDETNLKRDQPWTMVRRQSGRRPLQSKAVRQCTHFFGGRAPEVVDANRQRVLSRANS